MTRAPVVCMVSDGRGGPERGGRLPERTAAAARAGVHLVQVREPQLEGRALLDLVRACLAAVQGTRTRVLVNDRLDVAIAAGAHGVHLPGAAPPAARVRTMVPPGFLLGRSVHDAAEAAAVASAGGLDYLLFGTVFETPSKPGRPPAGVHGLAAAAAATSLPVLAIGGITAERAASVAAAGAAGFAAIGLFDGTEDAMRAAVAAAVRTYAAG